MNDLILIADDEQSVRHMLSRLLEGSGYTVAQAGSAEHALEVLEGTPADLVITDLKMPGMDGLSLAQKLLKMDPDRPVLLMTAYADLESARRAVGIGIYEYFTKPVDVNDVLAGVGRALEYRRLVLENRAYQKDLERKVEERTWELMRRVRELEARDLLLSQLLSPEEPRRTLGQAVKLALDLCACEAGAIYVPDAGGQVEVRAAVGFGEASAPVNTERLDELGLAAPEIAAAFREVLTNQTPVWVHDPDKTRAGFGIHSFGILPVCRGQEVIALLEVGRKRKDVLVGEADLELLVGFLPYVALAVLECKLQEELPEWEDNVEEIVKAAEKWGE